MAKEQGEESPMNRRKWTPRDLEALLDVLEIGSLPKEAPGAIIEVGALCYWDGKNVCVTTSITSLPCGVCLKRSDEWDRTVRLLLLEFPPAKSPVRPQTGPSVAELEAQWRKGAG